MSRTVPRPNAPALFTLLDIGRNQLEQPIRYFEQLGDTVGVSLFGKPLIASREPAVFEEVLVRQHKLFIKDELTRGLSKLLGQGLVTSDGDAWRKHRRILGPHFRSTEIVKYLPVFREEAEREMRRWVSGKAFDLHAAMARLSMRITLRTVFGSDGHELVEFETCMRDAMLYFVGVAGTAMPLPLCFPTPTNRRFLRARAHLQDALLRILQGARTRGAPSSVLQSLFTAQDSGELSEQQLLDEGMTLLVAGHETTALTLTYTLALLAEHPREQRAIHPELDGTFPDGTDSQRALPRLGRALKESLRLYPAAWAIGREALEDCEIAGYTLTQGSQVFLYQWAAHRHPRWFPEPLRFLPERWTAEFEASLPRCLYMPFGAGPRVCIGNHFALAGMLTVLSTFLRECTFELLAPFVPKLVPALTLRPRDPIAMLARPRATSGAQEGAPERAPERLAGPMVGGAGETAHQAVAR